MSRWRRQQRKRALRGRQRAAMVFGDYVAKGFREFAQAMKVVAEVFGQVVREFGRIADSLRSGSRAGAEAQEQVSQQERSCL